MVPDALPVHAGALLVFGSVLATSLGLPVPALPTLMLVAAGLALHPDGGHRTLLLAWLASILASLIGDTVWYLLGRHFGSRTLRALCSLSLSRDTCVRQTENVYTRFGVRVLAVAKFVPGLSLVAVPLAGAMGVRAAVFAGYDLLGAALWAGVGLLVGTLFAPNINAVLALIARTGGRAALLAGAVLLLYIGYRWWRRRSLLRLLHTARIDVDTLHALMQAAPAPLLFDVRSPATLALEPFTIPGSRMVELNGALHDLGQLDRHQPLVVYCACPNEVSAAHYAERLRREGFDQVHVLRGGVDAWRAAGKVLAAAGEAHDAMELAS
ncbi:MAG: DedA family protein/thiosulfate sulfurtransferase GlpE [Janthinobacterium lividum]